MYTNHCNLFTVSLPDHYDQLLIRLLRSGHFSLTTASRAKAHPHDSLMGVSILEPIQLKQNLAGQCHPRSHDNIYNVQLFRYLVNPKKINVVIDDLYYPS